MSMRPYLRSLVFICVLFSIFFSACRNEPKLPNNPWDKSVKVRLSGDPESLGYLYVTDRKALEIVRQLFLPLADFDPATERLTPLLAKSLPAITEITEGDNAGLVSYAFEIRPEATWADGSPVTGKDFLFTLKAIFNPHKRSIYASQFRRIKSVDIDETNPKKFTIYSEPYMMAAPSYSNFSLLPAYLYDSEGVMEQYTLADLMDKEKLLDREDLKALGEAMNSPAYLRSPEKLQGSGPYKLEDWITGQQISIVKRDNWWGDELGKTERLLKAVPERVIYKMIPDMNAAVSLMKNGELDVIGLMDWTTFLDAQKDEAFSEKVNFYTPDLYAIRAININTTKELLLDKKVRRAIAHLFDFDEINKTIWYGKSKPTVGPVYPTKPAYNQDLKRITFDIAKAKTLMEEAGWADTNGNGIMDKTVNGELTEFEIELSYAAGNDDYAKAAGIFSDAAKEAGLNINPKSYESSTYFDVLRGKKFDLAFSGFGDYPFNFDPANKWHTRGGINYASFGTAESDALIIELRKTIDVKKQDELSKQLQAMIYEEQPVIFLAIDTDRMMVTKKFGEITAYGLSPGYNVNEFNGNTVVAVSSSNN